MRSRSAPFPARRPKRVTIQAWDSMDALNAWYNGGTTKQHLKIGEKYATFRIEGAVTEPCFAKAEDPSDYPDVL